MAEHMRGAEIVMARLRAHGVPQVFTLSGNHIMSLFDAAKDEGPRLIHTRHEAAAVHMADAYGRLTGKPGVALVTGGPGHANGAAALFTALGADSPLVLLSGHAPTTEIGRGAFQEFDQAAMARPVTKDAWMVESIETLEDEIDSAMALAASGRPGPVALSLPSDIMEADGPAASTSPPKVPRTAAVDLSDDAFSAAIAWIKEAKRPILIGGPRFCQPALRPGLFAAADALAIPAVIQESPRGMNDPSLGAFAEVLSEADVIILAGKALDFTLKFGAAPHVAEDARVVAFDPDVAQRTLATNAKGDLALTFDTDPVKAVAAMAETPDLAKGRDPTWVKAVSDAVTYRPDAWAGPQTAASGRLHPLDLTRAVAPILDRHSDAVLIMDGGEIGQWAQATLSAGRRITNSVSGSIGASLPFALAARTIDTDAPVIAIMGDGTVGFHLAEFETAVREQTPFVVIVGNDAQWNAEVQLQVRAYGEARVFGCDMLQGVRYDTVMETFGGFGAYVTDAADLPEALDAALASGKPACINVELDGRAAPVVRRG
ncbi:MAG: thiamine pyrophosphate-binding protein [Pseudomonadota bacterium]